MLDHKLRELSTYMKNKKMTQVRSSRTFAQKRRSNAWNSVFCCFETWELSTRTRFLDKGSMKNGPSNTTHRNEGHVLGSLQRLWPPGEMFSRVNSSRPSPLNIILRSRVSLWFCLAHNHFCLFRLRGPCCLSFACVVARVVGTDMGLASFELIRSIGSKSLFVVSLFLLCVFGGWSHLTIACCVHRICTCFSVYFTLIGWWAD